MNREDSTRDRRDRHLGNPNDRETEGAGHDVRALSRRTGAGLTTGDLLTGVGIPAAMDGVDLVVHLATGRRDVDQAKVAIDAALAADVSHFVLISIVGIDDIPLGYYKGKVRIEKYLAESGLPCTVLRGNPVSPVRGGPFQCPEILAGVLCPEVLVSTDLHG